MSRYYGEIGYGITAETSPGFYEDTIVEYRYTGELLRNTSSTTQNSQSVTDNIKINNRFSIVADQFAYTNFHNIRYITYMGVKWKVQSVEIQRPRLIITTGDVYNE